MREGNVKAQTVNDMSPILSAIESVGEYLTNMSSGDYTGVKQDVLARRLKTEIAILQSLVDELERGP